MLVVHHESRAAARRHDLLLLMLQVAELTVGLARFLVGVLQVETFLLARAARIEELGTSNTLTDDVACSAC